MIPVCSLANSPDKQVVRTHIHKHCQDLHTQLNRPLNMVWLARNDFEDLFPIFSIINKIRIPENEPTHLRDKKIALSLLPEEIRSKVTLMKKPCGFEDSVIEINQPLDIVNADFCGHYHALTECMIIWLMHFGLADNSLFFMTVRDSSQSQKSVYRAHLRKGLEDIDRDILSYALSSNRRIERLEGFPKLYFNQNSERRTSKMYTFGYKMSRL